MEPTEPISYELTLFGAVWRYRWLVLLWVILLVVAAVGYVSLQPVVYEASALLVIEDPRTSELFGESATSERFVRDRVAILRSETVARSASTISAQRGLSPPLTSDEILEQQDVRGFEGSDLIEIGFIGASPEIAIVGANSIALAYEDLLKDEAERTATDTLAVIEEAMAAVVTDLADVQEQINARRAENPTLSELDAQLRAATDELVILQSRLARATDPDVQDEIRQRLSDIRLQIQLYEDVQDAALQDPELAALERERQDAINRQAALASSRTETVLESQVAETGVAINTPAVSAAATTSLSRGRAIAVALVLGGLSGAAVAYLLASRRRAVSDRSAPELILQAPLLAEVPNFVDEGLDSQLPVRDAPRSASAEAFRFAAVTLDITVSAEDASSVLVISSILGAGKTTAIANTAIAAAREGHRVLVLDADFGNQQLTKLLSDQSDLVGAKGITDIQRVDELHQMLWTLSLGEGISLSLLSRGTRPVVAADFFRSPIARDVFLAMAGEFDLILIDCPPLLQVAYASTLAGLTDAAVVVVDHESDEADLARVADRMRLIGKPIIGYIYNKAPLRREMTASEGSMADILGDQGTATGSTARRRGAHTG